MIVLGMDSTARVATVAVTEDEKTLACFTVDSGMTQSELLLPMARQALAAAHLGFADVELFSLTVGPGSFTGVRIGAALVKGLTFGKDVPCAPVSILEALAENLLPLEGIYAPVMDARRDQVYHALFRAEEGRLVRLCEDRVLPIGDLLAELKEVYPDLPVCFAGDAAEAVAVRAQALGIQRQAVPPALCLPSGAAVARCGLRMYREGRTVTGDALAPVYLRLPQAERERLEREQRMQEK